MRKQLRRLLRVFAALMVLSATSASADRGTSCKKCDGYYDAATNFAVVYCADPEDGNWGNENCQVSCGSYPNVGGCWCAEQGAMCLYIVVNG